MVALTATTWPSNRRKILNQWSFRSNAEIFVESPDRLNIKISSKCIPNNDQMENVFAWLISDLTTLREKMSRHVIFCDSIADVSKLYVAFVKVFGATCELINMTHSKTNNRSWHGCGWENSNSYLNNIVHYGLPREMDTCATNGTMW